MKNKITTIFAISILGNLFCTSGVSIDNCDIKDRIVSPSKNYIAIIGKVHNSSYEVVFLVKDSTEINKDDLIYQVKGRVDEVKWNNGNHLIIKSDGHFRLFKKEQYLSDGGEKYKGIEIDLIHHQW